MLFHFRTFHAFIFSLLILFPYYVPECCNNVHRNDFGFSKKVSENKYYLLRNDKRSKTHNSASALQCNAQTAKPFYFTLSLFHFLEEKTTNKQRRKNISPHYEKKHSFSTKFLDTLPLYHRFQSFSRIVIVIFFVNEYA